MSDWKLVPVEPTSEMCSALLAAVSDITVEIPEAVAWDCLRGYRAMLAAAPVPATEGQEGYASAFYELADLMGLPAMSDSPATVWKRDMLPAVVAALARAGGDGWREPHVFLDCDGVLADFDTYAEAYFGMPPRQYEKQVGSSKFWQQLEAKGDFYRNLPLMPDAHRLVDGVRHLKPTILTGCPRGDWAQGQKVAWAAEHFPGIPIITCRSADKRDYAKRGDVLIDDWAQHRHRWIEMGGVFITHHDADSSLAALWAHYPLLPAAPDAEGRHG